MLLISLFQLQNQSFVFFSEQNLLDKIGSAKMITASALALEVGFDKYKTAEFLKVENLPYPKTFLAKNNMPFECMHAISRAREGNSVNIDSFYFWLVKNYKNGTGKQYA